MKSVKTMILSAVAFGLLGGGCVAYFALQDQDFVWGILGVLFIAGVLVCGRGLWRMRAWALKLSWALVSLTLGLGIYIAHFRWTFWLFQTPNLWDRILSVLDPRGSLYVIIPLVWLFYSCQRFVRSQFK